MGIVGRLLISLGVFLIIMGLLFIFAPKIPILGKLPGDIFIRRGNFTFIFPITTSVLISLILTVLLNLVIWLIRR